MAITAIDASQRLAALRTECDGTGEYSACWEVSEKFERTVAALRAILDTHQCCHPEACPIVERVLEIWE